MKKISHYAILLLFCLHVAATQGQDASGNDEAETEELTNNSTAIEKRGQSGNDVTDDLLKFGAIVAAVMGMASNPLVGVGVATFVSIIDAINHASKGETNIWNQISDRVEVKIEEKITNNYFNTLVDEMNKLEQYMKPETKLTARDLSLHIMTMKDSFLPQTFPETAYTTRWMTALPAFVVQMVAAHLDLIKKGELEGCKLAKELKQVRTETIQAAKALHRARYWNLKGTRDYKAVVDGTRGIFRFDARWLTFQDGDQGLTYSKPLTRVYEIFYRIEGQTSAQVWDVLVNRMNNFFSDDMCSLSGCDENDCPKPIEKREVEFSYPRECYGTIKGNHGCKLPCQKYGNEKTWCPTEKLDHTNLLWKRWDWCDQDDHFKTCMPVTSKSSKYFKKKKKAVAAAKTKEDLKE